MAVIFLRFAQGIGDSLHLCRGEGSCGAVVADGAEAVGESRMALDPFPEFLPCRFRRYVGAVELGQLRAPVLSYFEVLHVLSFVFRCKGTKK